MEVDALGAGGPEDHVAKEQGVPTKLARDVLGALSARGALGVGQPHASMLIERENFWESHSDKRTSAAWQLPVTWQMCMSMPKLPRIVRIVSCTLPRLRSLDSSAAEMQLATNGSLKTGMGKEGLYRSSKEVCSFGLVRSR